MSSVEQQSRLDALNRERRIEAQTWGGSVTPLHPVRQAPEPALRDDGYLLIDEAEGDRPRRLDAVPFGERLAWADYDPTPEDRWWERRSY